jgi:hypothetical protein
MLSQDGTAQQHAARHHTTLTALREADEGGSPRALPRVAMNQSAFQCDAAPLPCVFHKENRRPCTSKVYHIVRPHTSCALVSHPEPTCYSHQLLPLAPSGLLVLLHTVPLS